MVEDIQEKLNRINSLFYYDTIILSIRVIQQVVSTYSIQQTIP